tara:strand:- start:60081 stop:60323 length:243 start_codon:yes stop_codon:yes gene_type:complete
MAKREKLIARFLSMPSDFHYEELVRLLGYFGFKDVKIGKISGSRVKFENEVSVPIILHKPHQNGVTKRYQMRQIKELLEL